MKERLERTFRHLHGKHYTAAPAARRLGAFAAALALATAIVLSPAQGLAYALTGEDEDTDTDGGGIAVVLPELDEETPVYTDPDELPPEETGTVVVTYPDPDPGDLSLFEDLDERVVDPTYGVDFANYLKDGYPKLEYRKQGETGWTELPKGTDPGLSYNDEVQVTMEFTLPPNTLKPATTENVLQNKIFYKLPTGWKGFKDTNASNYVTTETGDQIGTYKIADGYVQIKFDKDFVNKNADLQIVGKVAFSGKLEDIVGEGGGSLNLSFRETDSWNITVKPRPVDLKLEKQTDKAVTDLAHNVVGYEVKVSSTTGTQNTPVTLHDTLTTSPKNASVVNGAKYDETTLRDTLEVYKNGDRTKGTLLDSSDWTLKNVTVNGRESSFDLVLPPLEAEESYTVYYRCEVVEADKLRGDFSIQNTATATSGPADNPAKAGPASAQPFTVGGIIKKGADYDKTNHTITWTVTVNECQADIGGYYLRDFWNRANQASELKDKEVQMFLWDDAKNEWGDAQTVRLPYYFGSEENHGYYKFVYTTPDTPRNDSQSTSGSNKAWNRAYLTTWPSQVSGLDSFPYSTWEVEVDLSDRYRKTGDGIGQKRIGTAVPLLWTMTLNPARDLTSWTFSDTLQEDQFMAPDQQMALEAALVEQLGPYGYKAGSLSWSADGKTFTAKGSGKTWPANTEVTLQYTTSADPDSETDQSYTFTNKAVFDGYVMTAANHYHSGNVVQKVDVTDGTADTEAVTEHEFHDLPQDESGRPTLKWDIIVTVTDQLKGAPSFTITDTLPEGVALTGLKLKGKFVDGGEAAFAQNGSSWTADVKGTTLTATVENNVVTLKVPDAIYANRTDLHNETLHLEVTVTPTGTDSWEHNQTYRFLNSVKVSSSGLQGPHESQQEQDIFYNANYDAVRKTGEKVTNADNQVRYTVQVNPQGKQYLDGKSRLKLTDTLTYTYNTTAVLLKDQSVHVYKMTADGEKGGELSAGEYSYTYQEGERKASGSTVENVLTFDLPDATPLLVEYIYYGKGGSNATFTLDNNAVLEGTSSKGSSADSDQSFSFKTSSAQADAKGIKLYKVDSESFSTVLKGAEFRLDIWNSSTQSWDVKDAKVVSGQDGQLTFRQDFIWQDNTAYRLTETKTPAKYYRASDPLYFYLKGNSSTVSAPAGVNVVPYEVGQTVYVTNQKVTPGTATPAPTATLELYKYTLTENGPEPLAGAEFVLYRLFGGTKYYTVLDSSNKAAGWTANAEDATVIATPEGGWLRLTGLPGGVYYLEETAAPKGYDTLTEPVTVTLKQQEDGTFAVTVGGQNALEQEGVVCIKNNATPTPEPTPTPTPTPTPEVPVLPVLPVTPLDPSEVPVEPETPASSDSREEPASSESTPEQPAESEQPASSDSGEQPASPEDPSLRPGAPTPDNQDGWVLGEHGKEDAAASGKPGTPTPDNQKGWVLNAKDGTALIQTGQLNWPIPVLVALGGALVAAGVWLNHRAKRHKD